MWDEAEESHDWQDLAKGSDTMLVSDPYGKSQMLEGGVGCFRLRPKQTRFGTVYFMGASTDVVDHSGIPWYCQNIFTADTSIRFADAAHCSPN